MIIGRDWRPISNITVKFMPKPRRITAHWSIFLEVNFMPFSNFCLSLIKRAAVIPASIEMIAPPMTGNRRPSSHDGRAMARHRKIPAELFFMKFICKASLL